jgi:SAM-dependent methyltransferase
MINLASSARVAPGWNNVDFSWLLRIGRYKSLARALHRAGVLSDYRYERMQRLNGSAIVWDLRKGIPFEDGEFDVVYHSHFLEHIDREAAPVFLRECYRVTRPGGRIRVVVPDLEVLARNYVAVLDRNAADCACHSSAVEAMIDQMVVRVPRHRAAQPAVVQLVEKILIGNTDRAGVLHRWMYDRHSLANVLREAGYVDVAPMSADESNIAGWNDFGLDLEPDGTPYMPNSLYMEAVRPG